MTPRRGTKSHQATVPPALHELESEVMEEVWLRGEITVRAVMEALNQRRSQGRASEEGPSPARVSGAGGSKTGASEADGSKTSVSRAGGSETGVSGAGGSETGVSRAAGSTPRAYTTYMTIMARLHKKGLLFRHREGKTDFYAPAFDRERYVRLRAGFEVDDLVAEYGDVALSHFARQMAELDPARRRALQRLAKQG